LPPTTKDDSLPPPIAFGLPGEFVEWRPYQTRGWQAMVDAKTRFVAVVAPTGAGKSLMYMTAGMLIDGRQVVLTGTKGLQDALGEVYEDIGLVDVRGQENYACRAYQEGGDWYSLKPEDKECTCQHGPCHVGFSCSFREAGCHYYDQVRIVRGAEKASTNYAWWFANKRYGQAIEDIAVLVLDEAHSADQELSKALQIKLDRWLLKAIGLAISHSDGWTVPDWKEWGTWTAASLKGALDAMPGKSAKAVQMRKRMQQVEQTCRAIAAMAEGDWVQDHTPEAFVFECLNPKQYAEGLLFQGAKKVVFTSATLTKKTLDLLGVPPDQVTWCEIPSTFPVARRPVIWVPTVRVDTKMTDLHWSAWADRIDQIVGQRTDRKGIIHCVSYARGKRYFQTSIYQERLVFVKPGETVKEVAAFKASKHPLVLISPAIMTGWDFPDDECRFQVIAKLPFPDTRSNIVKAWQEKDKEWGTHQMMQNLVQAVGRGMRSETDWCETLIVDDHWAWVWSKCKAFAPGWFWPAVRKSLALPPPLHVQEH